MPAPAPRVEALFDAAFGVRAVDHVGEGDERWLQPAEARHVARAVPARRADFAAGRACARRALAALGFEAQEIPANDDRSPRWPDGITASISHTHGYAVAVAARAGEVLVGVDAEQVGRVTPKLYRLILTPAEDAWLRGCDGEERLATAVFAAKEAFYKAQFQATAAWVNFTDVRTVCDRTGALSLHPATDLPALAAVQWPVTARWHEVEGIVIAAVAVRPTAR